VKSQVLGVVKSPVTRWDTARGDIQMLQPLPRGLVSGMIVDHIVEELQSRVPDMPELPDFSGEWIPPFTGFYFSL